MCCVDDSVYSGAAAGCVVLEWKGVEEMKAKGHGRVLAGARLTDGRRF